MLSNKIPEDHDPKQKVIPFPQSSSHTSNTEQSITSYAVVKYLGIVIFLMNFSFVMFFSLFSSYLTALGHSQTKIGILEGVFEFISQILKFGSGFISDFLKKRKALVLLGSMVVLFGRVMIGFASHVTYLIMGRAINSIGNGLYSIPRDSLVAAAAPKSKRAQSLGLVRSLGQLGSFGGAIFAAFLLKRMGFWFTDIFKLAIVPVVILLLIIVFKVKEVPFEEQKSEKKFNIKELKNLGSSFFLIMFVNAIFMLGRCNEAFMGPYAMKKFNMAIYNVPYIMITYNISWTLFSYPIGVLSDRIGRMSLLYFGILALIISSFLFYVTNSLTTFFLAAVFWGIQTGVTLNTFTSLIVDTVKPDLRGTAFGVYFLINAICLFIADASGGVIADYCGSHAYMYLMSAICGALSLGALALVMKYGKLKFQH